MLTVDQGILDAQAEPACKINRLVQYKRRYWNGSAYVWESSWQTLAQTVTDYGNTREEADYSNLNTFRTSSVTLSIFNERNLWDEQNPNGIFAADGVATSGYEPFLTKFYLSATYVYEDGTESAAVPLFIGYLTDWRKLPATKDIQLILQASDILLDGKNAEEYYDTLQEDSFTGDGTTTDFTTTVKGATVQYVTVDGVVYPSFMYSTSDEEELESFPVVTFNEPPVLSTAIKVYTKEWNKFKTIETVASELLTLGGVPVGEQDIDKVVFPNFPAEGAAVVVMDGTVLPEYCTPAWTPNLGGVMVTVSPTPYFVGVYFYNSDPARTTHIGNYEYNGLLPTGIGDNTIIIRAKLRFYTDGSIWDPVPHILISINDDLTFGLQASGADNKIYGALGTIYDAYPPSGDYKIKDYKIYKYLDTVSVFHQTLTPGHVFVCVLTKDTITLYLDGTAVYYGPNTYDMAGAPSIKINARITGDYQIGAVLESLSISTNFIFNLLTMSGMTILSALQSLASIASYVFGFTRNAVAFFKSRIASSSTPVYTLDNSAIKSVADISSGFDNIKNEISASFGNYTAVVNSTTEGETQPTSQDKYLVKEESIGNSTFITQADVNIAEQSGKNYYQQFSTPKRRYQLECNFRPQLEYGDVVQIDYRDGDVPIDWRWGDDVVYGQEDIVYNDGTGYVGFTAYNVIGKVLSVANNFQDLSTTLVVEEI